MSANIYQSIAKGIIIAWLSQKSLEQRNLMSVVNTDDNFLSCDPAAKFAVIYWVGVYRALLEVHFNHADFTSAQKDIVSNAEKLRHAALQVVEHQMLVNTHTYLVEVCDCQMFITPALGSNLSIRVLSQLEGFIVSYGADTTISPYKISHDNDKTHIEWRAAYT